MEISLDGLLPILCFFWCGSESQDGHHHWGQFNMDLNGVIIKDFE
jgi:hypothetical protein